MSDQLRKELAELPFAEKLRILDKLRERREAFARAREKLKSNPQPQK